MFNFKNETKVGILAIIALVAGFWGYNFLKGKNIFASSQTFYVKYANVDQLRPSSPIFISGLQVGMVKNVFIDKEDDKTLIVELNIEKGIHVPKDATAAIIGLTLMGGKAVEIIIPHPCDGDGCAKNGDYLQGNTRSLAQSLLGDPAQLDAYVAKLRIAFDTIANPNSPDGLGPSMKAMETSLINIAEVTSRLNAILAKNAIGLSATIDNAAIITANLKSSNKDIAAALANLTEISHQLKNAGLGETAKTAAVALDSVIQAVGSLRLTLHSTSNAISKVDSIAGHLSNGDGSLGKMLTDDALYYELTRTTRQLSLLSQDLRLNPKRYNTVKLKLFGKNKTPEYANPLEDPAYKLLIDSLERDYHLKMMQGIKK